MSRKSLVIVTAASLAITALAAPAFASEVRFSNILFGTRYDDNVSTVDLGIPPHRPNNDLPLSVIYPSRERIERSQAEVAHNPDLRRALEVRGIRIKNVVWVQTAMNGGKVVYFK